MTRSKGDPRAPRSRNRPASGARALLPRRHFEWCRLHRPSAHPARRNSGDRQRDRAGGAGAVQSQARRRGRRQHPGRRGPGDPLHHPHRGQAGDRRGVRALLPAAVSVKGVRGGAGAGGSGHSDRDARVRRNAAVARMWARSHSPQRRRLSMQRRRFLVKAGGLLAATGAATVVDAPNVIAQPRVQWRMPSMWPPALDILQGNAQKFARIVDELTGGRFKIQVFAGGELMPATGVFDACLQGTVEAFNGAAYYWAGKENALQWFTSVPFGLNTQGYTAWYQHGGGLALWEEAYAPFGVVPRPGQSTNPQMGGWFRKKINTIDDFKGLKARIPGLAGKVYAKAGAAVVLLPAGEIYTALERGTIDAAEFIGPHDDLKLDRKSVV